MSKAKTVKGAKPAKTAKVAKPAKAAKKARAIGTVGIVLMLGILTGCAFNVNRTPILSESVGGESVVAYATNVKLGIGNKEATSIGEYTLSADGGLKISNLDTKNDSSAVMLRGVEVGAGIAGAYLTRGMGNAAAVVSESDDTESGTIAVSKKPTLPQETVIANATVLASKIAEAKASGKFLVVVAGNTGCGYCSKLDKLLDADTAFTGRADIVLYRETSPWATNQAGKWTGGGAFPVLRITQWNSTGNESCDVKVNRPTSVADIEKALQSCSAPK